MPTLVLVGLGGGLGAVTRYLLAGVAHRWTSSAFPVGTLCVNTLGCLAVGIFMGLIDDKNVLGPNTRLFLVIGFLGAFTTFSALGYETVELLRDGQVVAAVLNAVANYGLGLGAVLVGRLAVRAAMAWGG